MKSLLIPNKKSYPKFLNPLIGSHRLKDKDKDKVPNIFDCSPRNRYKDAPILPASLQAKLPRVPLTQAQIKQYNIPKEVIFEEQDTKQEEEQKKLDEAYQKQLESYNKSIEEQKKAEEEYNKQLLEYNKQVEEQSKSEEQYKKDLESYNTQLEEQKKAQKEYDTKLAEYNQAQEEYNKYQNEFNDWEFAKKLIFKGKGYAAQGDTSKEGKITSTYYKVKYLQERGYKSGEEMGEEYRDQKLTESRLKDELEQYNSQLKKLEKQGYQGMTTKEGIIFTLVEPTKPTLKQLTEPTKTILTPFYTAEPVKPSYKAPEVPKSTGPTLSIQPTLGYQGQIPEKITKPSQIVVNPLTGRPYGELTKTEKPISSIYQSPIYQSYQKGASELAKVPTGFGLLLGSTVGAYYEAGRPTGTGTTSKIARGGLMAGKVALAETNPITGFATATYFGGQALSSAISDPLGFVTGTGRYIKEEPFEFAGGIVGGIGGAKVRGKIIEPRIREAINQGNFKTESTGIIKRANIERVETVLNQLDLPKEQKVQIKEIIEQGGSVNLYKTEFKPAKGFEKYSPDIEGKFIEISDSQGNIVRRETIGKIEAKYEGKKITSETINEAVLKLEEETGIYKGYSEQQIKGQSTIGQFYEQSKITKQARTDKVSATETFTLTGYIGEKTKGKRLEPFKETPSYFGEDLIYQELSKRSKPISKTTTREIQVKTEEGILDTFVSKGKSDTRFIKEERPLQFSRDYTTGKRDYSIFKEEPKQLVTTEEFIELYHGTTETKAQKILDEGLKPTGELKEVYLTPEKGFAEGFAGRQVAKSGFKEKPVVLEVRIPKSEYQKRLVKRETGIGGITEVTLREVPEKYIKKSIKPEKIKPVDEIAPSYINGGQVGLIKKSAYEGKSFRVPFAGEEAIYSFKETGLRGLSTPRTFGYLTGLRTVQRETREVKPIERTSVSNIFRTSITPVIKTESRVKVKELTRPRERTYESFITPSALITPESLRQPEALKQPELLKTRLDLRTETSFSRPTPRNPTTPIPKVKKFYSFMFPEEEKITKEQGYRAYAYIDTTKKPKKVYLNEKPLTKKSALSRAAEYVDSTISARGGVEKVRPKYVKGKKVTSEVITTGDNYYESNKYKFRQFQQRKGTRTKLPNQIIELQKYRLDSPNETRKIQKEKSNTRSIFGF